MRKSMTNNMGACFRSCDIQDHTKIYVSDFPTGIKASSVLLTTYLRKTTLFKSYLA